MTTTLPSLLVKGPYATDDLPINIDFIGGSNGELQDLTTDTQTSNGIWNGSQHIRHFAFFFQFELFSSGRDLVISPRLSPPAIRSRAPTAAGHSLFLLVSTGCWSNLVVYSMLLCEIGTVYSLKEKWLLCRDISAFNMCHFCCHTAGVVCASSYERSCVFSRNCE